MNHDGFTLILNQTQYEVIPGTPAPPGHPYGDAPSIFTLRFRDIEAVSGASGPDSHRAVSVKTRQGDRVTFFADDRETAFLLARDLRSVCNLRSVCKL